MIGWAYRDTGIRRVCRQAAEVDSIKAVML